MTVIEYMNLITIYLIKNISLLFITPPRIGFWLILFMINVFSFSIWHKKEKINLRLFWIIQMIYIILFSKPLCLISQIGKFFDNFYVHSQSLLFSSTMNEVVIDNNYYLGILAVLATVLITFYVLAVGDTSFKSYLMNWVIGKDLIINGFIFIFINLLFGVNFVFLYGVTIYLLYKIIVSLDYYQIIISEEKLLESFKNKFIKIFWEDKKTRNIDKMENLYKEIKQNLFDAVKAGDLLKVKKFIELLLNLLESNIEKIKDNKRALPNKENEYFQDYWYLRNLYRECGKQKNAFLLNTVTVLHHEYAGYYKEINEQENYYLSLYCLVEVYEAYRKIPEINKIEVDLATVRGFRYGVTSKIMFEDIENFTEENLIWLAKTYRVIFALLERASYYKDDKFFDIYLSYLDIDKQSIGKANIEYYYASIGAHFHLLLMVNEYKIHFKYRNKIKNSMKRILDDILIKTFKVSPLCSSLNFFKNNNLFHLFYTKEIFMKFSIKEICTSSVATKTKVDEIFIQLLNTDLMNSSDIKKYFKKNPSDFQDLKTKMNLNVLNLYNEAIGENDIEEKEKRKKISVKAYRYKFIGLLKYHFSHEFLNIVNIDKITKTSERNLFYFNHLNSKDTLTTDLKGLSKYYATLITDDIKEKFFKQALDQSIIKIKKYNINDIERKIQDDCILIKGGYNNSFPPKDFNLKYLKIKNGREGLFLVPKKHIKTITFLKPSEDIFEYKNGFSVYMDEATKAVKNNKISYQNTSDLDENYTLFLVWGIQIEMEENAIIYNVELKE